MLGGQRGEIAIVASGPCVPFIANSQNLRNLVALGVCLVECDLVRGQTTATLWQMIDKAREEEVGVGIKPRLMVADIA